MNHSKRRNQQHGGSDWRHSSHAVIVEPGTITRLTLSEIDNAPMFHPLQTNTKVPMGYVTTGIVPEGIYYMNQAARQHCRNIQGCGEPGRIRRRVQTGREDLIAELKKAMRQ